MKKTLLFFFSLCTVFISFSQTRTSNYDNREAFNPQFYPYPGNEFRSANGEPGPRYWQNRADYLINCSLDTGKNAVTADVVINYTNNSPDNLKFLWLQVDQDIYKKDSRASATTTQTGGRWANATFTNGDVIKSITAEYNGKTYTPKYNITDTRMQVWLQDELKSTGGKISLTIKYDFTIPEYGTDRMGRMKSRNGWIYEVAQWYPRMCVYDDIEGWNTLPYWEPVSFTLSMATLNLILQLLPT